MLMLSVSTGTFDVTSPPGEYDGVTDCGVPLAGRVTITTLEVLRSLPFCRVLYCILYHSGFLSPKKGFV